MVRGGGRGGIGFGGVEAGRCWCFLRSSLHLERDGAKKRKRSHSLHPSGWAKPALYSASPSIKQRLCLHLVSETISSHLHTYQKSDTRRSQDIPEALAPLVDFAKEILKDYEKDWKRFPIFLKATAGMRELSYTDREAVLSAVRDYLGNPETCPFYFQFDNARVISGEEVRARCGASVCSLRWSRVHWPL